MDTIGQAIRNVGPMRLAVVGLLFIGLIGFFSFVVSRLVTPSTKMLYSGLENADSQKIITQIQSMGVSYELKQNGSQIFVGDVANPINDGTQLPAEDVLCKGDPGSCPANQYDICISDYPVEDYLEPANSYILNLGHKTDDKISSSCPI